MSFSNIVKKFFILFTAFFQISPLINWFLNFRSYLCLKLHVLQSLVWVFFKIWINSWLFFMSHSLLIDIVLCQHFLQIFWKHISIKKGFSLCVIDFVTARILHSKSRSNFTEVFKIVNLEIHYLSVLAFLYLI